MHLAPVFLLLMYVHKSSAVYVSVLANQQVTAFSMSKPNVFKLW